MEFSKRVPPGSRRRAILRDTAKACAILVGAILLCEGLYLLRVDEQSLSIVMVLAIFIIAATTDGYWYGLASAIVGVTVYDFLVILPRLGFSFTLGFPITLCIMLLVSLATSTITARIKRQAKVAQQKERYAELLYDVNKNLLSGRNEETVARRAMEYLAGDLNRSVILYTAPAEEVPVSYFHRVEGDVAADFFASPAELAAARQAAREKRSVGPGEGGCKGYYHPAVAQGEVYGVFGVSAPIAAATDAHMSLWNIIMVQTAQALRVRTLVEKRQQALVMAETEKARNSFLRGISHDLRTPLTSIMGASETFLESYEELSTATHLQLVEGIRTDAQWLLSMVENILSVTRLHQANMSIRKTEEAAEEVVGQAVSAFRRRGGDVSILIRQPDTLLLVPMDALLITQVLNNLLENCLRHGGGGKISITISMTERAGFAEFEVCDTGRGIPADVMPDLFKIQPARPGLGEDASRGLGMGLSICKTIIEAHGGWIRADNLPTGGARFTFALPMEEEGDHGE